MYHLAFSYAWVCVSIAQLVTSSLSKYSYHSPPYFLLLTSCQSYRFLIWNASKTHPFTSSPSFYLLFLIPHSYWFKPFFTELSHIFIPLFKAVLFIMSNTKRFCLVSKVLLNLLLSPIPNLIFLLLLTHILASFLFLEVVNFSTCFRIRAVKQCMTTDFRLSGPSLGTYLLREFLRWFLCALKWRVSTYLPLLSTSTHPFCYFNKTCPFHMGHSLQYMFTCVAFWLCFSNYNMSFLGQR